MKIKTTIAAGTTAEKQIGTTTEIHPVTITTTTEITTGVVEITWIITEIITAGTATIEIRKTTVDIEAVIKEITRQIGRIRTMDGQIITQIVPIIIAKTTRIRTEIMRQIETNNKTTDHFRCKP